MTAISKSSHRITKSSAGQHLAYNLVPGCTPTVVFLPGFMSDRKGTKALYLEEVCRELEAGYLRLDYSGHGDSGGEFLEGSIGRWTQDALEILAHVPEPWVLVGSSMGGWIMLNIATRHPEKVAALIGIAPALDFTVRLQERLTADHHRQLQERGYLEEFGEKTDQPPYRVSRVLLEEGRKHLHLGGRIPYDGPVRLIHGKQDAEVPWQVSREIAEKLTSRDVNVIYIEDGEHRLSRPGDLILLRQILADLLDSL